MSKFSWFRLFGCFRFAARRLHQTVQALLCFTELWHQSKVLLPPTHPAGWGIWRPHDSNRHLLSGFSCFVSIGWRWTRLLGGKAEEIKMTRWRFLQKLQWSRSSRQVWTCLSDNKTHVTFSNRKLGIKDSWSHVLGSFQILFLIFLYVFLWIRRTSDARDKNLNEFLSSFQASGSLNPAVDKSALCTSVKIKALWQNFYFSFCVWPDDPDFLVLVGSLDFLKVLFLDVDWFFSDSLFYLKHFY